MNEELDLNLRRLAADTAPPRLAFVEKAVLQRVAGHRFASADSLFRFGLMATLVALLMGIAGGLLPSEHSSDSFTPLLDSPRLAPSSLLADDR